jgi:hypothetical protein
MDINYNIVRSPYLRYTCFDRPSPDVRGSREDQPASGMASVYAEDYGASFEEKR